MQLRDTVSDWAEQCKTLASRERQLKACCQDVVLTGVNLPEHRNICHVRETTTANNYLQSVSKECNTRTAVLSQTGWGSDLFSAAVSSSSCNPLSDYVPAPALGKH